METLFIADIGGTKSDLAIFPAGSECRPLAFKRYINANFSDPIQVIDEFLDECGWKPEFGCLAVAGPVRGDTVTLTNLSWELNGGQLRGRYGWGKVLFINDLTAVSCSILELQGDADLQTLQPGTGEGGEIYGIIAPGTGLGEGFLARCGKKYIVQGSEGGHCDFAPVDQEQLTLLDWMQQRKMPVSYEMLISGSGLPNLYRFCSEYLKVPSSENVTEEIDQAAEKTPLIVSGAVRQKPCPLCSKTIDLFLSILGSEAGNLALTLLARGGIYLGGGILPRLVGQVSFDGFLAGFRAKGRMASLMPDFPVYLIIRSDAALLGAGRFARDIFYGSRP